MMGGKKNRITRLCLLAPILILVCLQLLPVVVVLLTSLRTPVALLEGKFFSLDGFFLGNYVKVWSEDRLAGPLVNSLAVALGSLVLSVTAGSLAAYALARFEFRLKGSFATIILCARLVPPVALAVPLFLLVHRLGLADTRTGLILAHSTFNLPFAIWLLVPFFKGMPKQLEEAALVDGASFDRSFCRLPCRVWWSRRCSVSF